MIRPKMSKSLHVIVTVVILLLGVAMASAPVWLLWFFSDHLPVPAPFAEPLLGCFLMVVPAGAAIQLASLATGKSCPFGTRFLVQSFAISACLYVLACVVFQA
jgi:hypothetical protein